METKYRDIADGNLREFVGDCGVVKLETKYRDIADGNARPALALMIPTLRVGNQVPRYSGFKTGLLTKSDRFIELSPSVVFITNAWCYTLRIPTKTKSYSYVG